ncbi:MAG TPA: 3-oxoacyl-[acyl-carrier-protein] reductase [Verrucomicrobiales bacterium]|nr:3-oxoacyl-[acyl-carrier-protein] reductase [Verrucomicrobiales bacterium]
MKLTGKTVLITGGSRGIGYACAMAFAAEGCTVHIASRSRESLESAREKIRARHNVPVEIHAADFSKGDTVRNVVEAVGHADILVNNAGITRDGLLMRMSDADWDSVLNTNLKGAFSFTKAFTRAFLKQRSGRIINISSVIGLMGNAGQANYAASKAGLIGFTKSIARELGSRGITVNAIAPGFIETDMTAELGEEAKAALLKQIPLGCLGNTDDIAAAALYLASPGARYVTGQVLTVDGGMVM